jgi:hypothetical protein
VRAATRGGGYPEKGGSGEDPPQRWGGVGAVKVARVAGFHRWWTPPVAVVESPTGPVAQREGGEAEVRVA